MSTPETSPGAPSTPERSTVPPLESALRYDAVDDLWQKTKDIYYAHHHKDADTGRWTADDSDLHDAEVTIAVQEYLRNHGLDEGSEDFAKLERRLRQLSFDRTYTRRWKYGDWVDPTDHTKGLKPGTSGASRVRKLQLAFTGRDLEEEAREAAYAASEADETEDGAETETSPERLSQLRKAKQEAFVNQMKGSAFGKKKRALQEAYKEAELAYMVALTAANKRAIDEKRDELVATGKTDEEIAEELKTFAKREVERVNKEDQEEQHRLLVEKSGAMGRFLEWYSRRSTLGKVGLGMGLSAVAIASGVGIGFAAGALGGVVGAGVVSGASFGLARAWGAARVYQLRLAELYKFPTHLEKFDLDGVGEGDSLHLKQRTFLEQTSRDQLANGERVKKRAVYWALGTTALGGALGVGSHVLADQNWDHLLGGQVQHWLSDRGVHAPWDHDGHTGGEVSSGAQGDVASGNDANMGDFKHIEYPTKEGPIEGGVKPPETLDNPDINNHFRVESGSGLIRETYQSANAAGYKIDMKTAEDLYQATREHFGDKDIIDIANIKQDTYLYGDDLRLSAPGKAVWRDGVTDYMEKWLQEHGHGVIDKPSVDHVSTAEAIDKYVDNHAAASKINNAEGWYNTFKELDIKPDKYDDLLQAMSKDGDLHNLYDVEYKGNRVLYWDGAAGEPRISMTPDGRMPDSVLEPIVEYANNHGYLEHHIDIGGNADMRGEIGTGGDVEVTNPFGIHGGDSAGDLVSKMKQEGLVNWPDSRVAEYTKAVGPELSKMRAGDGSPVAYYDRFTRVWRLYQAPSPDQLRMLASIDVPETPRMAA